MKPKYKIQNQLALDELAQMIGKVPGERRRRKLWHLHSELSRTAPGIQSARAKNRTGFVCVKRTRHGRYAAMIATDGRQRQIGTFSAPEDAYGARARFMADVRHEQRAN